MAKMNITLPAMGEGVIEATINKWLVSEGAQVKEDDPLVEVATDKVDSEVPAPAAGTIVSINVKEGSVAKIGDILAVIENNAVPTKEDLKNVDKEVERVRETIESTRQEKKEIEVLSQEMKSRTPSGKFISPLVRSIASREGISYTDLDKTVGTGMDGRITKDDILKILDERNVSKKPVTSSEAAAPSVAAENVKQTKAPGKDPVINTQATGDEIIPMDRVRKIIAEHMVMSKRTSPHVTSFIDADVTRLMNWISSSRAMPAHASDCSPPDSSNRRLPPPARK
jgi:2-oxoglutarate dehydrogenase E2 component (dihydrolipoamide succinyltransferase)